MNRLSTDRRAQILAALVEGNSLRSTSRMTGAALNTVTKLLEDVGYACHRFHDRLVHHVNAQKVQCDEIWGYAFCKEKNRARVAQKDKTGIGSVWTFTGLDPDSKLVISWYVGRRSALHAVKFMEDLASRLANRVQLTTDGHWMYRLAVPNAFGNDVDFAQLIKFYGESPEAETRYSPPRVTGTEARPLIGNPAFEDVSTSHVERQNLTMRMGMRRLTRLTNGFSKKITNLRYAVALHFAYYNWCRPHRSLKGDTPAMRAGLADHKFSLEELAELPLWIVRQEWEDERRAS